MNLKPAMVYSITLMLACTACSDASTKKADALSIEGTWQLISGTTIEKKDTTVTDYTQKLAFIKVINADHFAFLKHDLTRGKDTSTAAFSAGGGRYSLKDSSYTEHLEYCSDRQWENNDFTFTIRLQNDTLTQSGVEKVDSAGVNRINTEKYVRFKKMILLATDYTLFRWGLHAQPKIITLLIYKACS